MRQRLILLLSMAATSALPALAQGLPSAPQRTRVVLGIERGRLQYSSGKDIPPREGTTLQLGWRINGVAEVIGHGTWFESPVEDPGDRMRQFGLLFRVQPYRVWGPVEPFGEIGYVMHQRSVGPRTYYSTTRFDGRGLTLGAGLAMRVMPGVAFHASAQYHDANTGGSVDMPPGVVNTGWYGSLREPMRTVALKGGVVWRP